MNFKNIRYQTNSSNLKKNCYKNKWNCKMKDQGKLKAHRIFMIQKQTKVNKFIKKKFKTKKNQIEFYFNKLILILSFILLNLEKKQLKLYKKVWK